MFSVQLEDCAFQLYKHNGTQYEYGSYLDLETTLAEQSDELDGFSDKYVCTSLSYIFYAGVSLASASCCRRWPLPTTLALTTLLG